MFFSATTTVVKQSCVYYPGPVLATWAHCAATSAYGTNSLRRRRRRCRRRRKPSATNSDPADL